MNEKVYDLYDMLIFSLSVSIFDMSTMTIQDGVFSVRSNVGDKLLRNEDFDSRTMIKIISKYMHNRLISWNIDDIMRSLDFAY